MADRSLYPFFRGAEKMTRYALPTCLLFNTLFKMPPIIRSFIVLTPPPDPLLDSAFLDFTQTRHGSGYPSQGTLNHDPKTALPFIPAYPSLFEKKSSVQWHI